MEARGILFIVSAPSGAGKTTLCNEVLRRIQAEGSRELRWSCSYTTRAPRTGEVHGRDYFFVSDEEFDRMVRAGEFAEWARVHGHKYGTSLRYLEQAEEEGIDLLLEIDWQGARQLREKYTRGRFIFVLPPSGQALQERLVRRGTDSAAEVAARLETARTEVEEWGLYEYLVLNDDFDRAADELWAVITAERCRRERKRETVEKILKTFETRSR
jgi:guanylate kinase